MKKVTVMLLMLMLGATLALAQQPDTMTMNGYIIDNQCAYSQSLAQMDEFIKVHSKECALAPACMASGYSIYADHKLTKFDKKSNAKIAEFLKNPDSNVLVVVDVKKTGDKLELLSIKNE